MQRRRLVIAAAITAVVIIAVVLAWPWVRIYTGSAPPDQFYSALPSPVSAQGRQVLGVAHNAGNNAATTAAALRHGADVIEIDVVLVKGTLAAGRAHGWWWLAERVFRGESLDRAWHNAAAAKIVKLDLQQNDKPLLDALVSFLRQQPGRPVMISTRDAAAITYLRPRVASNVTLLFSVPFPDALARVQTDRSLADSIGGISVFQGLVSANLVSWAHERKLVVLAWTVNDGKRLNELLHMDVDGITTANLAILQILSG
jgi:hypothetical protein